MMDGPRVNGRVAVGDRAAAFRDLLLPALDAAYRRAAVLLANRMEAEDAVHDAAERAWRSWSSLRDPSAFEAWFGRILVNVCRDRLRRRKRVAAVEVRGEPPDGEDAASTAAMSRVGEHHRVLDALAFLSADERIAVVLRYDADLTVPEIARLTGAREGTIKSRLHHGLRKLRTRLEAEGRRR
jgi:RNA polymerase sigma-70 factor (ECF subfamily)